MSNVWLYANSYKRIYERISKHYTKMKLNIYLSVAHASAASITFTLPSNIRRMCDACGECRNVRRNHCYWLGTFPFLGHGTRFMDAANNERTEHTSTQAHSPACITHSHIDGWTNDRVLPLKVQQQIRTPPPTASVLQLLKFTSSNF